MKNKYDFSFLLVEFKDLYKAVNTLKEEDEPRLKINGVTKVIKQSIINIYLKNNIFYNSEKTLKENIEFIARKEILPYSLMKYLLKYIEDIKYSEEILENKINSKKNSEFKYKEISKVIYNEELLYELLVWMTINLGEEDYSLFFNKLKEEEKHIFSKYLIKEKEDIVNNYEENLEEIYIDEEDELDEEYNEIIDLEDDNLKDESFITGELYYLGKSVNKDYFKAKKLFEISASEGNKYSQSYLGLFYEKGYGCNKDIDKAIYWYKKAALNGNSFSQYSLGYLYFTGIEIKRNLEYSFKWYKEAAENDFPPAQYALSYLYKNGEGCEKSIFKAYYWLEISAENDFEDAYYILGQSYLEGRHVEKDYSKAFFYLSKGAEKGDIECLEAIGDMYYNGIYLDEDREKAFYYYNKSIEEGNIKIYYKLGKIYEEEENIEISLLNYLKGHNNGDLKATQKLGIMYYNGEGVEKDEEKALKYMEIAIEGEDPHSLYVIGVVYLNRDREKGLEYLKKAYKKGSHYAAEILASEYLLELLNNKEVKEEEILEYINFAVEKDLPDSIYYYGLAHIYGIGLDINTEKAFELFIKAANKGSEKSMLKLGNCYKHGVYVKENIKLSLFWYEEAAKKESVEAYLNIIEIYEKGIGIEIDEIKALQYAYRLRDINLIEGDTKLIYYNAKGIGVEPSEKMAREYLKELLILDEGKYYNILGELSEEELLGNKKEESHIHYLRSIGLGEVKAFANLEYYLHLGEKDLINKKFLSEIKGRFNIFEYGKCVYVEGVNNIKEGKKINNNKLISRGLKDIKKSIHLGFYEGINYLINYYETEEINDFELYKYKQKKVYYRIL
ncbi:tetratricopeptide repeat protein [Clostridium sp.]|uniref:tetratricopeptide repeat protein n=1 Tax=Clostridium sp. TaxID=1506 RepID=UPI0026285B00|nr:tetratricopeptide repeat protein [Clostridium sp.]